MKNVILVLALAFPFYQCSEGDDCCVNLNNDTHLDILVKDEGQVNLVFNNTINESNVKTYHVLNGQEVEYFEENLDAQRGVLFVKDEEEPFVRLFPNSNIDSDSSSITIIDWGVNGYTRDTILSKFDVGDDFLVCRKVTLNGVLVWDSTINQGRRIIEVIK